MSIHKLSGVGVHFRKGESELSVSPFSSNGLFLVSSGVDAAVLFFVAVLVAVVSASFLLAGSPPSSSSSSMANMSESSPRFADGVSGICRFSFSSSFGLKIYVNGIGKLDGEYFSVRIKITILCFVLEMVSPLLGL